MPVMNGVTLVKEVRKLEGSTVTFFFLGSKDPKIEDPAVDFVDIQALNWTHFLTKKLKTLFQKSLKSHMGCLKVIA